MLPRTLQPRVVRPGGTRARDPPFGYSGAVNTPPALWVDCDTGIDDALALLYLTRTPCALVGVSTVAGNCTLRQATANTRGVLALAGAAAVPVHAGAAAPLVAEGEDAHHVHGDDGLGGCASLLPSVSGGTQAAGAVDALAAALRARPGVLTLVATGPLTNLALLLRRDPAYAGLVRRVVVMGGTDLVPGNVAPTVEFNFGYDADAAAEVLDAPWPVTVVGLDVTRQVTAQPEDVARLTASADPVAHLAGRLLASYGQAYARLGRSPAAPLHDPLAAAVAVRPELVRLEEWPATVEARGQWTRGMLVVDRRLAARAPVPTRRQGICVGVQGEAARTALVEAWARGDHK